MANKNDSKTISSVSDILGFILEQSEKPPDKRRPIKQDKSDSQADSEYVSAVVDALAAPGVFVGEQTLGTLQNLVDLETKINTQKDRIGVVKIKLSDIPDIVSDPGKFVDALFEKNRKLSKMQRLQWAGEQMRMLAGSTYAKHAGLFEGYDPEMKAVLERGVGQVAMQGRETDQAWMIDAAEKLYNSGSVKNRLDRLEAMINRASSPDVKARLESQKRAIESAYNIATDGTDEVNFDPLFGFRSLLREEFRAKQEEVLNGRSRDSLSENEKNKYDKMEQARSLIGLWGRYDNLPQNQNEFKKARKELSKRKETLVDQLKKIRSGQITFSSSAERNRTLSSIRENIKAINSSSSALSQMKFWSNLGKWEGAYYGIQNALGPGGLGSFLIGDFLDPRKSTWACPSSNAKFITFRKNQLDRDDDGNPKNIEIDFYKAVRLVKLDRFDEKEKGMKERRLRDHYNQMMVNMYYMMPTTWIRSLATGEAFAWVADKNFDKLTSAQFWGIKAGEGELGKLRTRGFWQFYRKFKGATSDEARENLLKENEGYRILMNKILWALEKGDSDFAKKFKKAEKLLKKIEGWSGLAWAFNTPQRIKAWVVKNTVDKVKEGFRKGIYKLLANAKWFAKDKAAMALLEAWKKAGGKALTGALSKAVVSALGLAGTAFAGPVGAAVTLIVSAALDKLLKVTLKVTAYVFLGITIAVFGFLILSVGYADSKMAKMSEYTYEIPGEVYKNPNFTSYGQEMGLNPIDDEGNYYEGDGQLPEFVSGNLPAGETCLFVAGSNLRCTQGPFSYCTKPGYKQPSHKNSPAIDVAIGGNFAAPQFCNVAEGNCVVDAVGQATCGGGQYPAGGFVQFSATYQGRTYQFYILHVAIGVSSGQKLGPGQAVATIVHDESWRMCSTGLHAHVVVKVDGRTYNPRDVLNEDFGCSIGTCPVHDVCYITE